jgi:hypothetical protein
MARVTTKQAVIARKSWQERAETWRDKIRISEIITRLNKCAEGEVEMTPTQVKAATTLLSKVLPDLSASDHTSRTEVANPQELLAKLKAAVGEEAFAKLAGDLTPEGTENAIRH